MKRSFFTLTVFVTILFSSCTKNENKGKPCDYFNPSFCINEGNFKLSMPSAFSPNGDGLNDMFGPLFVDTSFIVANSFSMTITTKSRDIIFQTQNPLNRWNVGSIDTGRYFYNIRFQLKSGTTIDTCGMFFALKNGSGNCLMPPRRFYINQLIFEDQFDLSSGAPIYNSSEMFCP